MRRLVIKVGGALLSEGQEISLPRLEALCDFIAELRVGGYEVILVSSAAVVSGYTALKLDKANVSNRQALAAIGQPLLMNYYRSALAPLGILPAQLLLSAYDFDSRKRTQNAQNTIEVLLQNGILPIINENDATETKELNLVFVFGDNDRLSAHVAHYFGAEILLILSDIDGYYDKNPREFSDAKILKVVHELSKEELEAEVSPNSAFATGGIVTKLQAADFLLKRGGKIFLASGLDLDDARSFLLHGVHNKGTLFVQKDGL
ncbi:MAG: glutamate 5-kinase [Wolinella sp.]